MKKALSLTLSLLLSASALSATAFAADSADVYVTIADDKGELAVAYEKVTVTDTDADGALTIADALACAHDKFYDGGAAAGFGSYMGDYGLAMNKLWGVDNGGSYGYCVNYTSAMSLADEVASGDYIGAYCYTDLTAWSDTYCYFEDITLNATTDGEYTVVLAGNGYDENWNPTVNYIEGAEIYIDGVATGIKTDAQGKAAVSFEKSGTFTISAKSDSQVLVPPVCIATVSEDSAPATGVEATGAVILAVSALAVCALNSKKRK